MSAKCLVGTFYYVYRCLIRMNHRLSVNLSYKEANKITKMKDYTQQRKRRKEERIKEG